METRNVAVDMPPRRKSKRAPKRKKRQKKKAQKRARGAKKSRRKKKKPRKQLKPILTACKQTGHKFRVYRLCNVTEESEDEVQVVDNESDDSDKTMKLYSPVPSPVKSPVASPVKAPVPSPVKSSWVQEKWSDEESKAGVQDAKWSQEESKAGTFTPERAQEGTHASGAESPDLLAVIDFNRPPSCGTTITPVKTPSTIVDSPSDRSFSSASNLEAGTCMHATFTPPSHY